MLSKAGWKPYIISGFVAIFLILVFLEVQARFKAAHESGKHIDILHEEKFPLAAQLIADRHKDNGLAYYDYYIFAYAPFSSETVTFTSYYSSRYVPDSMPIGEGDITIWLFGGSTMANMETIDSLTIANQLALNLKKKNIKATVVNFGLGGFQSSLESIKFQDLLRRVDKRERPDIVIFYDGFNDAGHAFVFEAGTIQEDLSKKMEALVTGSWGKLAIYSTLNFIGKHSYYWKNRLAYKFSTKVLFGEEIIKNNHDNLLKAVDIYGANTRMIRGVCKEFHITPIFILQPMIYTKKNLTQFEKNVYNRPNSQDTINFMKEFYEIARKRMCKYDDFYDMSDILNNSERNDFYDLGHTGPYTGITIGHGMFEIVEAIINRTETIPKKHESADLGQDYS